MRGLGNSMSHACATQTSFVREYSSCHTKPHGLSYGSSGKSTKSSSSGKGGFKSFSECPGKPIAISDDDNQGAENIKKFHGGNLFFGNFTDSFNSSDYDYKNEKS